MQYTKINIKSSSVILDVQEGAYINQFVRTRQMPEVRPMSNGATYLSVMSGAVLYNEGFEEIDHRRLLGSTLAYPDGEAYSLLTLTDIYTTTTMISGGLKLTPFAALVQSAKPLEATPELGLSLFRLNTEMDIITNLLNRECVYAVREVLGERNRVDFGAWRASISDVHLLELSFGID